MYACYSNIAIATIVSRRRTSNLFRITAFERLLLRFVLFSRLPGVYVASTREHVMRKSFLAAAGDESRLLCAFFCSKQFKLS